MKTSYSLSLSCSALSTDSCKDLGLLMGPSLIFGSKWRGDHFAADGNFSKRKALLEQGDRTSIKLEANHRHFDVLLLLRVNHDLLTMMLSLPYLALKRE